MSLFDGSSKSKSGCFTGGCSLLGMMVIFIFALIVAFLGKTGSPDDFKASASTASSTAMAASCGSQKWKAESVSRADCGAGIMSKKISPNGFYHATYFGCSGGKTDPGDKCNPGCPTLSSVKTTTGVVSLKGTHWRTYEDKIGYFSANSIQYGCGNKLKITNPSNGKAVIVMVIDGGPNCSVQGHEYTLDMPWLAEHTIDAGNLVKVEKVPKDSPIGPVSSCTASAKKSLLASLKEGNTLNTVSGTVTQLGNLVSQVTRAPDSDSATSTVLALLDSTQLSTMNTCQALL